jgi:hypothetical protein
MPEERCACCASLRRGENGRTMRRICPIDRSWFYRRHRTETQEQCCHDEAVEVAMDQATIAYWLT